ncbi:hypothetical protein PFRI_01820 [Planktotalea frisia]|uniref:Uncharacterized protein n=1 Tax=Planktotalea frisia TaxID=696762 RepID=A0A1L9P2B7_9RHOB|nr:hypothetical protein PFRI_01820 [Planktotalea frisia]
MHKGWTGPERANSFEKLFAASANFPKLEICSPITGTYPKTPS